MQTIALYVNDPSHARQLLPPMLQDEADAHWIVVACPPVLRRHVGRWLSQAARRQWRERWANQLFDDLDPCFQSAGANRPDRVVARRALHEETAYLQRRHPTLRLIDARSVRVGQQVEPICAVEPTAVARQPPGTLAIVGGFASLFAMAD